MAGRRRSLLDRARTVAGTPKAGAPEDASHDEEVPAPLPDLEPVPPPPLDEPLAPPTPEPRPREAFAEVADEPAYYADKTTGPPTDTQPMGWGNSVHSGPDPIDDFFDTSAKGKGLSTPTPGATPPAKDPPRPVARDTGPAWADPMGVPGPPPLPGLSDRFTPPPAERRTPATDGRPSYLPTPPPAPPPDPRAGRRKADDDDEPEPTDTAGRPFGLPPIVLAGLGLLAVGLVIGVVAFALGSMSGNPQTPVAPPSAPVRVVAEPAPGGVPVRSTLNDPSGAEVDTAAPIPVVEPVVPGAPVPAPGATPGTAPAPAPVAAPAPRPKPAPTVAPLVVTRTGTLRVRSNRKVLVFVNGRAMGHAPLDLPLVPGGYTLTAALPSRPDTEQTQIIDLSAGETERVDFNF